MSNQVREIVKGIIDNKIFPIVHYEIGGTDFVNDVIDQLPTDDETDVVSNLSNIKELDMELYNKFIDHLTDISMSTIKIL